MDSSFQQKDTMRIMCLKLGEPEMDFSLRVFFSLNQDEGANSTKQTCGPLDS